MVIEVNNGVVGGWTLPAKPCHSCHSAPATVYCRPHSAFLCLACDARIHKVGGTRHERVWLCEVCEQAPAAVTCKADAASLCVTCDADIHSANPLSQRHDRVPIDPFFAYDDVDAESLLIPDPDANVFFPVMDDPFLDFNYPKSADSRPQRRDFSDSVVPVQTVAPAINHLSSDLCGSKLSSLNYPSQSLSQTVSSSSFDAGVVPDGNSNSVSDTSYPIEPAQATQLSGTEREARVMRYREKRKKRKFEKTIRYASRKAYAETRPRIKGRFAKRTESESYLGLGDCQYGVVPSFHFAA